MNLTTKGCAQEGNCSGISAGACALACLSLAAGAAIGAAAMYLFDPNRGRARRARLTDEATSAMRKTAHEAAGRAEDLRNRAQGALAKAAAAVTPREPADDRIITDRVRSLMGHLTRHAHSVESEVKDGNVILRGSLPEEERRSLVAEVGRLPGVKSVIDCIACPVLA